MRTMLLILVAILLTVPARAERASIQTIRAALVEAQLQVKACQWAAAERVLKGLRQTLMLEPEADPVRTRVEFVIWDLRMGLHDQAGKDLDLLVKSLQGS